MEMTSRIQDRENHPSTINSPRSNNGTSPTSNNSNGSVIQNPTPPLTPKTISTRSETTNPYPTTFVQADTNSFKQVVQMLTGSSETAKQASVSDLSSSSNSNSTKSSIPPVRTAPKKPGFKLYERRNSLKNGLRISPLIPGIHAHNSSSSFSPRNKPEILSPSILDFPSLALSPVTPLNEDTFSKSSSPLTTNNVSEEDKAIAEKKFYLHPSPRRTPRDNEPQLLPLFPVSSPRVSGSN
ncbi:VQ motif-containing protein 4-like [Lycium barbarum]|uniref:VQ motif-containing protein 4-like n=1 Tax=Lycium barbarum TaxID=112863 RepID=UPI00293EFD8C|nr:VQ motif-containing protein 4-like [Lycium barbarum]